MHKGGNGEHYELQLIQEECSHAFCECSLRGQLSFLTLISQFRLEKCWEVWRICSLYVQCIVDNSGDWLSEGVTLELMGEYMFMPMEDVSVRKNQFGPKRWFYLTG